MLCCTAAATLTSATLLSGVGPSAASSAPTPVRNLVASVIGDQASISWQPPTGGTVARYKIDAHRNDGYNTSWPDFGTRIVGGSTTSIVWDRLPLNQRVYFVVTPIGSDGPNYASGPAGPLNSTGTVTGSNSYCPSGIQDDCVVVNTTKGLGTETRPGDGLLHGLDGVVPAETKWVGALNLKHWRISSAPSDPHNEYSEASAVVGSSNLIEVLSDSWTATHGVDMGTGLFSLLHTNGYAADPWANWTTYDTWVTQMVQQAERAGQDPYWEIQNEPENYPYDPSQPPTRSLVEQQYLHAYSDIVKAVSPFGHAAKIVGPSIDWVYENPDVPIDMKTFIPFAAAHGLKFTALAWHEISRSTDQNPLVYADSTLPVRDEAEAVRELVAENPSIGSPELFVDENSSAAGQFLPGFAAGYFAEGDRAGIDEANRSCWPYPTDPSNANTCFSPDLGQLLNSNGNPDSSYWTMVDYGTMNGTRVPSESTDMNLSSLAVTDSSGATRILLGLHQTCSQATTGTRYCAGPTGLPAKVPTTVQVLVPSGATSVSVRAQDLPNTGTADTLVAPPTTSSTVPVTNGVASISTSSVPNPPFGDGDAYLLTVTPNSTAGASPSDGNVSNEEVPPPSGPSVPTRVLPESGGGQTATILTPFSQPIVALATDQYGNPEANTSVTFQLAPDYGHFLDGSTTKAVLTDAYGIATSPTIYGGTYVGHWPGAQPVAYFTHPRTGPNPSALYGFTNQV